MNQIWLLEVVSSVLHRSVKGEGAKSSGHVWRNGCPQCLAISLWFLPQLHFSRNIVFSLSSTSLGRLSLFRLPIMETCFLPQLHLSRKTVPF